MTRAATAVALVLLGGVSSLASVAVHHTWWFTLAVATPLVTGYAASPGLPRVSFVAGWFVVLTLALIGRPEGDYVIGASWQGYGLLLTGLVLLVLAIATIPRPRRLPS